MSPALLLYRILGSGIVALALPWALLARRGEVAERLGGGGGPVRPGCLWIHAASLGEYQAVRGIVEAWAGRYGPERLLVSCTNPTARARLAGEVPPGARVRLAPVDVAPAVRRALDRERPACLLIVETEIWPEWIRAAAARSLPIALVNARISDRTLGRYRRLRRALRPILERISVIGCRGEEDRLRWIAIGAPETRCAVWGNTKLEAGPEPDFIPPDRDDRGRFVLVAGSVRTGEEEILDLSRRFAGRLRLIVAPRHSRSIPAWERACLSRSLPFGRLGAAGIDPSGPLDRLRRTLRREAIPPVILVDAVGFLNRLYRAADAAFVGGTWVPIGGHNLFEPARAGIPVFFGPRTEEVRDVAEPLLDGGGGVEVAGAGALAERLSPFLDDPALAREMGRRARTTAKALSGATRRALDGLQRSGIPPP